MRHAWLQKHPSPLARGGEFHWYPDAGDRELRAGFVERLRGVEPPAVLWQLEPGRVAWGQLFAATAPTDGRRYVGLVLTVVEGAGDAADLFAALAPPPAEPWSEATGGARAGDAAAPRSGGAAAPRSGGAPGGARAGQAVAPRSGDAAAARAGDAAARAGDAVVLPRGERGDVAGVVRALLSGGAAQVADPVRADLPQWIASIARVVAPGGKRAGVWSAQAARRERDAVAELAAAAWREPGARAAAGWRLLGELAEARGETLDRVGAALDGVDAAAVLTADERAQLAAHAERTDTRAVLHAWGRGRFDASPAARTLPERLAELVALGVLGRLAADEDGGGAIAEARWHALLPAPRRTALLAAVAARTASLRGYVEALDA